MVRPRRWPLLLLVAAACATVRPARPDVAGLIAREGVDGAADVLTIRIAASPREVGLYLAIAEVEERRGRPLAALKALLDAEALDGPLGPRLGAVDRARLGRLLITRAAARTARGAPSALADLAHASALGVAIDPGLHREATFAAALAQLRHVDGAVRALGRARLRALAASDPRAAADPRSAAGDVDAALRTGARARVAAAGVWLWDGGARRASLEALDAWASADGIGGGGATGDAGIDGGRDVGAAADRWLRARRWWRGGDGRPDLAALRRAVAAGASPCAFPGTVVTAACAPAAVAFGDTVDGPRWQAALLDTAAAPTAEPGAAAASIVVALRVALADGRAWDDAVLARVDLAVADDPALPGFARPTLLRLSGRADDARAALTALVPRASALRDEARLVIAAESARAGRPRAEVAAILGELATAGPGQAILARLPDADADATPDTAPDPTALRAAARYAAAGDDDPALLGVASAHARDAALGDRRAADYAARGRDDAERAARLADLYTGLGDGARARRWAEAADASSPGEASLLRALALAVAAAGDPDAARLFLDDAAAVSGDGGATLVAGARALVTSGAPAQALDALKLAVQLVPPGSPEEAAAYALAAAASRALDRAPPVAAPAPPTAGPGADASVDELAAAAPWRPRDVALRARLIAALPDADPRRRRAVAELVALADSADRDLALAAVVALRSRPGGSPRRRDPTTLRP